MRGPDNSEGGPNVVYIYPAATVDDYRRAISRFNLQQVHPSFPVRPLIWFIEGLPIEDFVGPQATSSSGPHSRFEVEAQITIVSNPKADSRRDLIPPPTANLNFKSLSTLPHSLISTRQPSTSSLSQPS